jgi:dTDP-4-dehydrorhamnose reductase
MGITNRNTLDVSEFIIVNSLFPRMLADYCEIRGARMIHISTDCVFSGAEGNYCETDPYDDENIYGISKSAGEPLNCTTIRTSIIGESKGNLVYLLEWIRSHKNTTVNAWKNHIWNGITCLQFAKLCEKIIESGEFWRGTRHIYSPISICKADLVEFINNLYELNNVINKVDVDVSCDRTLTSIYPIIFTIPSIRDQIIEQKNFKI